jgi:hypothetical protein
VAMITSMARGNEWNSGFVDPRTYPRLEPALAQPRLVCGGRHKRYRVGPQQPVEVGRLVHSCHGVVWFGVVCIHSYTRRVTQPDHIVHMQSCANTMSTAALDRVITLQASLQ